LNWKTYSLLLAVVIIGLAVYYFSRLAEDIARDERKKIEVLAESFQSIAAKPLNAACNDITFESQVVEKINTVPLILTDDSGNIIGNNNIDSFAIARDSAYLSRKLKEFQLLHE